MRDIYTVFNFKIESSQSVFVILSSKLKINNNKKYMFLAALYQPNKCNAQIYHMKTKAFQ